MRIWFKNNLFSFECFLIWSLIVVNIDKNEAKNLPKTILCADIECKDPIGTGKTNAVYIKRDDIFVSFKPQTDVKIFGKTEDEKYLDIEVKGKRGQIERGLAPKSHITEIFTEKKLNLIAVDISQLSAKSKTKQNESTKSVAQNENIAANSESSESAASSSETPIYSSLSEQSLETQTMTPTRDLLTVIDGTSIFDDDLEIESSSAESLLPSTATKTPTIHANFDKVDIKYSESNDPISETISADNQKIEPSLTQPTEVSHTSEIPEAVVESENKSEDEIKTEENITNISDSTEEKKEVITDSTNSDKSADISAEKADTSAETIDSSVETVLQSNDSLAEDKSLEASDALQNTNITSEELKNETLPEVIPISANESKEVSDSSDSETKSVNSSQNSNENKEKTVNPLEESNENNSEINVSNEAFSDLFNNSNENISENQNSDDINKDINTSNKSPVSDEVSEDKDKEELQSISNSVNNDSNSELNIEPNVNNSEVNKDIVESERSDTSVETNDIKNDSIVDNPVDEQKDVKPITSESENNVNEDVVSNQLSDSLPPTQPNHQNFDINYNSIENQNLSSEETIPSIEQFVDPINTPSEETLVKPEDSFVNPSEAPDVSPPEITLNAGPESILDETADQIKDNILNVENIDPIIDQLTQSPEMLKWLGLEGMGVTKVISDIIPDDIELILKQMQISAQVVVITSIIAFNWCLMKILLSIFNSSRKETELRNICCKAERQIYYFEAEKQKLQTEIDREREKARIAEERMQTAEHKVIPLEKEFIKLKNEKEKLHQKVVDLENELESAVEAGMDAKRLVDDFLTSQRENINLNSSVDALQQQITKQSEIVSKYESTAKQKEKENRELREKFDKMSTELERMKNILKETEHNLHTIQTNNEELKASKTELSSSLSQLEGEYSSLQTKSDQYIQRNDELLADVQKLTEELSALKEETTNKEREIESWKQMAKLSKSRKIDASSDEEQNDEELDQIDSENCDQSITDLYDIVKMDIQLKNLTNDKNDLISKLEEVSEQCRQLSQRINSLETDNEFLKTEKESAVRDRIKAENKLEVLTEHYRVKELEFGKAIGVQHIQRQQKEETADSLANQLVDLKEENTSLRSQLQSMKKEIEDTERKYKSNINQLEKQVHENWILARNAERKLDEAKAEASVLRQTLTMSVKSPIDGFGGDSFMDDSASSISDHFGGALPPPPPPPPMPLPPMFNSMPPMHMPFPEENDSSGLWNQSMTQSMSSMPMGGIPPPFPPMPTYSQVPNDLSMNTSVSFANSQQPVSYVPPMQQMGQQWDFNRDTYSPSSHRSTSSPHSQYNMYSQPNSHYSNPMTSMSSPMTNSSMSGQFQNTMTSVTSPLVNSSPISRANVLSEPTPTHWTQPQRANGNIPNLNYSHNQYNESEGSSRPTSRNEKSDNSLHTSIV